MSDDKDHLTEDSSPAPSQDRQLVQQADYRNDPNPDEHHDLQKKPNHGREVLNGVLLLALLHVLLVVFPFAYFAIGIAQVVYLIPALVIALVKKKVGLAQGLILGGVITFLLNAACFGVVTLSF
ncbi:hypothetical protein [Paenibacillus sp. YPG26]|uniref:hypothetical protein n=1 Tax=Paenibacillus sp. YPG26 TaxID=2878915 RepID=UPI00204246DA|nr:hypothetical protein [Paenibacillus sp. YPG26]USB31847.1 hypothetical protein LDO05_10840 [Paenibacillus sp. YPG26]